jgi:HlyD family secretion protein
MRKVEWIIGVLILLLAAGFFYLRAASNNRAAAATNIPTAQVRRGTITSTVSEAGTVRPNQSAILNWQTDGKVGIVNVKVGDKVQANQELAALDPSSLPPALISAKQNLINAQKTLQNLQSSTLTTAQAEQAVANAQQALDTAKAKRAGLNGNEIGNQATIDQTHADLLLQQKAVTEAQQTYGHKANLPNTSIKRANAQAKLSAAQQKLTQDQATYNSLTSPATAQDISIADANVAVAQAQLQDAINQYNQVKNGPSAQDIAAAQDAVKAAQATLDEAQLKAPFAGTVTEVDVKPGDTTSPGLEAFRIDDLSSIYADLQVAEVDINSIIPGQKATLTFDAVPGKEYSGIVTQIGADGTATQGVVNYPVTVQITNPDAAVKSGMTAAVNIVKAQHSNVLIVPNQAIQLSGGQRQVTVLYEGQEIPVPVTVGLTNDTESEVTSNSLKEGDSVVLNSSAGGAASGNQGRGGGFRGGFGGFVP